MMQERSTKKQILLAFIAYFTTIAPGMSIGFSAVALPSLQSDSNPNKLSLSEASWFASIVSVATPVGCFISGPISDRYGRKTILLLINIITFLGWILIAFAYDRTDNQYVILLTGRILTGLSTGLSSMPATVYVAEISCPKWRGILTTASSIAFASAILIVYILGFIFQEEWCKICLITAVLPCVSMFLSVQYLPESPTWLVSKSRIKEATDNLKSIWGFSDLTEGIHEEIEKMVKNRDATKIGLAGSKRTLKSIIMKKIGYFKRPSCYKPFFIVLMYFFFQQFSGTLVIVFYALDIVKQAGVTVHPYILICCIALTRFIGSILVTCFSRNFGRRPPSILSGIGMTVCMALLCFYLHYDFSDKWNWMPVFCLIAYFFTSTLGFMSIPFAMSAECFPTKIRGTSTGLITCFAYIFNFIIVKSYPWMMVEFKPIGVFLFYGVIALIGTVFLYKYLPETKGKTLAEIEEFFGGKPKARPPIVLRGVVNEKEAVKMLQ